jgi:hypothetical protein
MSFFYLMSFTSQIDLFEQLQQLSPQDEIIEVGQLHRGEFLLLVYSKEKMTAPLKAKDFFTTDKDVTHWLSAYYKQTHSQGAQSLLFVETEKISVLLEILLNNTHLQKGHLLEVSRQALPSGKAIAIIENLQDFKKEYIPQNVQAYFTASPQKHLKNYF